MNQKESIEEFYVILLKLEYEGKIKIIFSKKKRFYLNENSIIIRNFNNDCHSNIILSELRVIDSVLFMCELHSLGIVKTY